MLEVSPVRAFNDNYLWLFKPENKHSACIVDPGDAQAVLKALSINKLSLEAIFITHHHGDHTGGIKELLSHYDVPVYGPDSEKIPLVTHPLKEGDVVKLFGETFHILEVPGHTLEHIAYYTAETACEMGPVLFCGDTLFAGGCGRVFEGTYSMMHNSLQKLASLNGKTQIFCAHEYTISNLAFAAAVSPDDGDLLTRIDTEQEKRVHGLPTVPSSIKVELLTNPFLRCEEAGIIASASAYSGTSPTDHAATFGILRKWKDSF